MQSIEIPSPDHRTVLACDYALINPLQVEASTWKDLSVEPIVPPRYEARPELFPVLLDLGRLDPDTRIGLLDRMQAWERNEDMPWFSALLIAPVASERLVRHFRSHMLVRVPDGRQLPLRIYDPRTFRHLCWLLEDAQMRRLLGPIQQWQWREPSGQWRSVTRPAVTQDRHSLRTDQVHTIQRLGEINLCLQKLQRVAPEVPDTPEQAQQLDALLREAWHSRHLSEREDRLLYAEQGMRYGARIHTHHLLGARRARVHEDNQTYVGACADLDPATYQHMRTELEQIPLEQDTDRP